MKRRECTSVITQMIGKIPSDKVELLKDLKWNYEDASYKPLEENLQLIRTSNTLYKHIPIPKEDWEFEILSIFTTMSIDELKQEVEKIK